MANQKAVFAASVLAGALVCWAVLPSANAFGAELKSYDSSKPSFWAHPPPDWFLGDETDAQKGLAPPTGPATPSPLAELEPLTVNRPYLRWRNCVEA